MSTILRRPADNEKNVQASLYFGNLDAQASEALLYELFIQFGPVRSLYLPKDRVLRTHQGFGFVEFRTVKDADYALEILRGVRLYGRILVLKKTDPYKMNEDAGTNGAIDIGAKIFINNLNPLIDEKYLQDTFSKFGTIIKAPQIVRHDDGRLKGHGFVTFDDFESSDAAIEKMNGNVLMNQTVTVTYAYKDDAKKLKHGDEIERQLAESAKENRATVKAKVTKKRKPRGK